MAKIMKGASIILIKNKKALLVLREERDDISYPNQWSLTGGHVEEGETFKDAAMRELEEETGYISKKPIYFETSKYTNDKGQKIIAKRYYEIYDEEQKITCHEGQKNKFLSNSELNTLKVFPGHRESAIEAIKLAQKKITI